MRTTPASCVLAHFVVALSGVGAGLVVGDEGAVVAVVDLVGVEVGVGVGHCAGAFERWRQRLDNGREEEDKEERYSLINSTTVLTAPPGRRASCDVPTVFRISSPGQGGIPRVCPANLDVFPRSRMASACRLVGKIFQKMQSCPFGTLSFNEEYRT